MSRTLLSALAAAALALPVWAQPVIEVTDAYARTSRPNAPTAAAFMAITNTGTTTDRLVAARFEGARSTELHTHLFNADTGVVRMVEVEEGFALAPGETVMLERGGKHVMLMGLSEPLQNGTEITLTLVFEQTGPVTITLPVDNARTPKAGGGHSGHSGHGGHGHGQHSNHGSDS